MWFVTVIEKMKGHYNDFAYTGETRCWGFFSDKEKAVQSLHENWFDMRENVYDYAVIEEYEEGLFNYTGKRQWFQWDEERQGYFEIEEPNGVKHVVCFAIGQKLKGDI